MQFGAERAASIAERERERERDVGHGGVDARGEKWEVGRDKSFNVHFIGEVRKK